MSLLTRGNPKTIKGEKQGFLTYILHLSPADVSGYNTCPKATEGCKAACLNTAGRGGMFKPGGTNTIQEARKRKTRMFFENRGEFMEELATEIAKAKKYAEKKGLQAVFRLNGTSDLSWEKYEVPSTGKNLFEMFADTQFYDYTKVLGRKVSQYSNYHLTFSRAESNDNDVKKALHAGMNVAAVYKVVPIYDFERPVINGDETDLRFLDGKSVIVGLKAKGRARKDTSGFVIGGCNA